MPIYEYLCPKCNVEFELRRPFSEADKSASCPNCNSKAQKLVSGFASKTGSYIQASGKPFRTRTTRRRGETGAEGQVRRQQLKRRR
ncbi:zinc ribbon domain-containing protein [Chloroflexota bacterium]